MQKVATFHRAEDTAVVTIAHILKSSYGSNIYDGNCTEIGSKEGLTVAAWPVQLLTTRIPHLDQLMCGLGHLFPDWAVLSA